MNKTGIKYLLVFLVLLLTLGTGCGLLPTESEQGPTWTYSIMASPGPPLPSFIEVVEKVKPSVVIVNAGSSEGSGWIIDSDGIIVTNNHVVEDVDADSVKVTLDDGRTFTAESVSTDSVSDLAVIIIDAQGLPAVEVGDGSRLRVGEPVAAIGNALGLGISMKGGWISRLDTLVTTEDGQTLYGVIETDAAINRGNSGGPLVNMAGEVIGITSVKLYGVDVEGIGYAISMETALPVIETLINVGSVVYPFLGVSGLHTVTEEIVSYFDLEVDSGVLFTGVVPGSAAEAAGLQAEDIIVAIDDEEVTTVAQLVDMIHSREVGQRIKITYWRGDEERVTHATLTERQPE
jgi:serine protease Do